MYCSPDVNQIEQFEFCQKTQSSRTFKREALHKVPAVAGSINECHLDGEKSI